MTDGTTAADRLTRLLYILPAASRPEGAALSELARRLTTTEQRILEDLEEVTNRAYYHPGGWPDDVQILLEADRVRVVHAGGMNRPVRLTTNETLCLALGLRGTAASSRLADPGRRASLLARAEAHLGPSPSIQGDGAAGSSTAEDSAADGSPATGAPDIAAPERGPDPSGIRETLVAAARHRRPCAVVYAKPDEDDLSPRVIHPYVIAYASGAWYVVGRCLVADGVRNFRLDRIVAAADADDTFDEPDDFRVEDWVGPGRVYRAEDDTRVRVRYAPRVARWVRERAELPTAGWTEEQDGSVVVEHRVADPHWVVRHTLQYGGAAEILEPVEVRALVLAVVEEMGAEL